MSSAFERTYRHYLERIAGIDLAARADVLAISVSGGVATIPLLGREHGVSAGGVVDPSGGRPIHSVSVVLCQYLLLAPDAAPPGSEWVTYKDFRDAAPFVDGFRSNTERAIARRFTGRVARLEDACRLLGGVPADVKVSCQLSARFQALPRVPITLLFNDEDEEFPADATVLFERRAAAYLDMECLAILGWLLADGLAGAADAAGHTIM
jgi:hypothetical protein